MKKLAAILMVAALLAGMTACGASGSTSAASAASSAASAAASSAAASAAAATEEAAPAEEAAAAEEASAAEAADPAAELAAMNVSKIDDLLYYVEINDYDLAEGEAAKSETMKASADDAAEAEAENAENVINFMAGAYEEAWAEAYAGGCASVVNGSIMGRNLDWSYNNDAYFVYKTEAAEGRHASIGVTGFDSKLTDEVCDEIVAGNTDYNENLKKLAYTTLDGINDAGLCATVLVVPTGAEGYTVGTNPDGDDLFAGMVVREVLDQCSSCDEAVELIKSRNLYAAHSSVMTQEFHWRFTDKDKTVVVEVIDNMISVLEDEPILTNFYMTGFDKTEETLPEFPEGIERYNILRDNYEGSDTVDSMMKLMKMVNFSQCYDTSMTPFWYSEYCGIFGDDSYGTLTSSDFPDTDLTDGDLSKAGKYEQIIRDNMETNSKGRAQVGEKAAWNTCYTSVYDLENMTLTVSPQETEHTFTFSFD